MNFFHWLFSAPTEDAAFWHGAAWGLILAAIAMACAFSLGLTFGQRCEAAGFERQSANWESCVDRLGKGGAAHG